MKTILFKITDILETDEIEDNATEKEIKKAIENTLDELAGGNDGSEFLANAKTEIC